MSSNVIVFYNNRRFTIKTAPNTLLQEVLTEACQRIKLSDPSSYQLNLGSPLRLSGLSQGAKLELVQTTSRRPEAIQVAVSIVGESSRYTAKLDSKCSLYEALVQVGEANTNSPIAEILHNFSQSNSSVQLLNRKVFATKLQYDSKENLENVTFNSLGLSSGSIVLKVSVDDTFRRATPAPAPAPVSQESHLDDSAGQATENPRQQGAPDQEAGSPTEPSTNEEDQFEVFTPSQKSAPVAAEKEEDPDTYEMSPANAKAYQNILTNRSKGPSQGTFMTRNQRTASKSNRPLISKTTVKLRFPAGSHVLKTFDLSATTNKLYKFAKSLLRSEEADFTLWIGPPVRCLENNNSNLVKDEMFSQRMVVNFQWDPSTPQPIKQQAVLKDEIIAKGLQSDTEALKANQELVAAQKDALKEEEDAAPSVPKIGNSTNSQGQEGGKPKMPKWLKFGKK